MQPGNVKFVIMQQILGRITLYFLFIFLCLFSIRAGAQGTTSSLRVAQLINFPSLPNDTIYQDVSYDSILVVVVNDDSIPFQGAISVAMLADSSIFPVYLSFSPTGVFLLPGDSITYVVSNYFFDPASFKEGNNIVVVWPVANVNVTDTLETEVYYVHATGISDVYSPAELYISPNPASNQIRIISTPEIQLEQVRIYGIDGRIIYDYKLKTNKIDINQLHPGIYYIYFYHRKGISIRKLVKQ